MLQSRYDLSYWVALLSTSVESVLADTSLLPEFLLNCEKAARVLMDRSVTVWYRPFPGSDEGHVFPQLIVYADAGYNTLMGGGSAESFPTAFGTPTSRSGIVKIPAHPIAWQARKMKRVARSPLAAEAVASSTSIDFVYWMRAVYVELLWGGI